MGYIRTFEEKIFCVTKLDLHQNLRTIKFCDFTTRERTGRFGIGRMGWVGRLFLLKKGLSMRFIIVVFLFNVVNVI